MSHGILLGVVGTDVALRELMRLAPRYKVNHPQYVLCQEQILCIDSSLRGLATLDSLCTVNVSRQLGIHGYAYLVTNNGYILSHPDLRPLVQTKILLYSKSLQLRSFITLIDMFTHNEMG